MQSQSDLSSPIISYGLNEHSRLSLSRVDGFDWLGKLKKTKRQTLDTHLT